MGRSRRTWAFERLAVVHHVGLASARTSWPGTRSSCWRSRRACAPNDSEPVCDGETVHSTCGFEFCAPDGILERSGGGDSCLNLYEANGCSYLGDYGRYSSPLDEGTAESNYKEEFATIDGLNAVLVSYGPTTTQSRPYFAGVHFAAAPKGADQRFTFVAQCNTTEGQGASLELFHTLRFDR